MRNTFRTIVVTFLALFGVVVMGTSGITPTMSASVQLLASYALKGAQVPVFNIESDQSIKDLALQYGGLRRNTAAEWWRIRPAGDRSRRAVSPVNRGISRSMRA